MTGLYIHIPFCRQKCAYCDFPSYGIQAACREFPCGGEKLPEGNRENALYNSYFTALRQEALCWPRMDFDTVFFGGGTPSLPPAKYVTDFLLFLFAHFIISPHAEITLEANPESISTEKLLAYRRAGINRLSIGLQAAQNRLLAMLGRVHNREDFQRAFSQARQAGFTNINIDIISSLPGQTGADWEETLFFAAAQNPEHISVYTLTPEKGTLLYDKLQKKELLLPGEEEANNQDEAALSILQNAGYARYEISNFTKSGFACRHNLNYWNAGQYLGLGLGAHSYLNGERFSNTTNLQAYLNAFLPTCGKRPLTDITAARATTETISPGEAEKEYIMLRLRLCEGIILKDYERRFGKIFLRAYRLQVEKLLQAGLAQSDNNAFYLTKKGLALQNQAAILFF